MKTYSSGADTAHLSSFEIEHAFITHRTIARLLNTVDGVSEVRCRPLFASWGDVRIVFKYFGHDYIAEEPFGDNSRYWIGPASADGDATRARDIGAIKLVFDNHSDLAGMFVFIGVVLTLLALLANRA